MKLIFNKVLFGESHMEVIPRAEFADGEEAAKAVTVDLGRAPSGKCVFPLANLAAHDHHAPPFMLDGTSPINSSAPDVTAEAYMNRIAGAIRAAGVEPLTVEIVEKKVAAPADGDDSEPDWNAILN